MKKVYFRDMAKIFLPLFPLENGSWETFISLEL